MMSGSISVFFESDGSMGRMVSTDGRRLSKLERTIADGPKLTAGVIISKKALVEILEQGRRASWRSGCCGCAVRTTRG